MLLSHTTVLSREKFGLDGNICIYANLLQLKFIEVILYGILLEFHFTNSHATVGAGDTGRSWRVTIQSEEILFNLNSEEHGSPLSRDTSRPIQ